MPSKINQNIEYIIQDRAEDYISSMSWSYNQRFLAVASSLGKISIYDVELQKKVNEFDGHKIGTFQVQWSPNELILLSSGQDGLVKAWDPSGIICEMQGGSNWVEKIQWEKDGSKLSSAAGKKLRIWDKDFNLLKEDSDFKSTVTSIQWNNSKLAACAYGKIKIVDCNEMRIQERLEYSSSLISLSWSPNGQYICASTQESTIHCWKIPHTPDKDWEISGYSEKVKCLTWNPFSIALATAGGKHIILWDLLGKGSGGKKPHLFRRTSIKNYAINIQ